MVVLFRRRIAKRIANRTFVRLGALTGACAAFTFAAAVFIADYFAAVRPADWPVRDGAALRRRDDDASLFFGAFPFCTAWSKLGRPPATPAAHRPLGGGRCATVFLFRRRIAKRIANRTFVRLGALTGACAAFTFAAAVFIADYFAAVRPADWPVRNGRGLAPSR